MKNMKKLASLLLAVVMVLSLSVSVFASGTVSLTINHITSGHTYSAYQLFKGDLATGGVLSNVQWGDNVNGSKLLATLKADDEPVYNSDRSESVKFSTLFASATTASHVVEILETWTSNGERLDRFAEIVGAKDNGGNYLHIIGSGTSSDAAVANGTTFDYTIPGLNPGYYIVIDTTPNVNGEDYRTKYMMQLTTDTTMTTKGDYTIVDKTVGETLDGTYSEYITQQLNKTYYYKWEAALDDEIAWYNTYKFEFVDTLSTGLTFEKLEEVYILEADNSKVYLYKDNAWTSANAKATTIDFPAVDTKGGTIKLGWEDLKKTYTVTDANGTYSALAGDDIIVVKYSATLNDSAVYGVEGNPNEVKLTFSNNPSGSGTGETVPDDAIVFSFQMKVNKVDADNHEVTLPGAKFFLYHLHGTEKHYAKVDTDDDGVNKIIEWVTDPIAEAYEAKLQEIKTDSSLNDAEKETKINELNASLQATLLETVADGTLKGGNLQGLKNDTIYYLHEAIAPEGYNKMFTDVSITIHASDFKIVDGKYTYGKLTYIVDGEDTVLIEGENFKTGLASVTVLNDRGNTLPSTGGMGTTLFYVVGGILFVGAAVVLITKKRMSAEN